MAVDAFAGIALSVILGVEVYILRMVWFYHRTARQTSGLLPAYYGILGFRKVSA